MKHRLTYMLFWISVLAGMPLEHSFTQVHQKEWVSKSAAKCKEKLTVFTDRSFYAVNEDIQFTSLLQTDVYPYNAPESSVLYLELISPAGNALAQGKYPVSSRMSHGTLSIPASTLSGTYYLRAYTRWMQNFGEEEFVYLPIRVVNPYQAEVSQTNVTGTEGELLPLKPGTDEVRVIPNRSSYLAGEMVEVECSLQDERGRSIPFGCLTVVREGAIDTSSLLYKVKVNSGIREAFQLRYLPDIGGIALSGSLDRSGGRDALADVRIHFSMLGKNPAFFVARSDSLGRFLVRIPKRFGIQEIFVAPDTPEGDSPEVRLDHDFSTAALPFTPAPFELDEKERSLGSRISLHMQLKRAYGNNPDTIPLPEQDQIPELFYGKADISVQVEEFVNLPNVEEVIENLVPGCFVKQNKGKKYISIESANPMIAFYSPLILVDNLPVFDPEIALAIPPSQIDRIEVVSQVYVIGTSRYGGIISIFSRDGDMAGIRLPESSYFFDYRNFHSPVAPSEPEPDEPVNFPDTRNTIYWSDQAALHSDASYQATFRAPSIPGNYLVLYRGISSEGKPVFGLSRFSTISSIHPDRIQR